VVVVAVVVGVGVVVAVVVVVVVGVVVAVVVGVAVVVAVVGEQHMTPVAESSYVRRHECKGFRQRTCGHRGL